MDYSYGRHVSKSTVTSETIYSRPKPEVDPDEGSWTVTETLTDLVWFACLVWVEFNAPPDTIEVISKAVFTANHLTDTDKQNSTGKYKQTQYKSDKVNNLKYSKTKLPWFSCFLQHSARKRGGLILQCPRAHTLTEKIVFLFVLE